MKLKRIFAALLCLCLLLALLPGSALGAEIVASGTCGANGDNNLVWTLNSAGTLTISGEGRTGDYSILGFPWYDYRAQIVSVILEDGVTGIGNYAFFWCKNITSISISNSVTIIGARAFEGCSSLTSITIPDSVMSITSNAFTKCSSLAGITVLNPACRISDNYVTLGSANTTTIYGYANSTAQAYAEKYGYKFCSLGDIGGSFAATRYSITLNGDGKASGHFTLRDAEGKPLPNTDFSYEYSYRDKTYTMYSHTYTTDDKGNFTLTTPKLRAGRKQYL